MTSMYTPEVYNSIHYAMYTLLYFNVCVSNNTYIIMHTVNTGLSVYNSDDSILTSGLNL